jgi:hypothetical protein
MLFSEVQTEVQAGHSGIDQTTARFFIQESLNDLCSELPLALSSCSLIVTSGTGEYSIAAGSPFYLLGSATATSSLQIDRLNSVFYVQSSTSAYELKPTTTEILDAIYPGWRYESTSLPTHYYIDRTSAGVPVIGFYPVPGTTSSPANGTGFPRVDMRFRTRITATYGGSDAVPDSFPYPMAIVYGALYRIVGRETDSGLENKWLRMYRAEIGKIQSSVLKESQDLPRVQSSVRGFSL